MIPLESIVIFFTASVALALAPGPDNIYVLTQSAIQGRAAGIYVTLGLCTGLLFHTAAVALGVAALFAASAMAFNALKFIGAGYLLYLAWQAFRAGASDILKNRNNAIPSHHLYARGVIMNITNPKVAIFFLAFLPQFADPARGHLTLQIVFFGALFIVAALLVFGMIAWFAGFLGERLGQSRRAQIILNRIAGTIFAGLALRLVTAQR
ncbi:MAG: LysE family translocator [Xanthomonadales bacterium]|nr:LysE family translocator [Gammaproteobacteria bacterium]MBT8053603.1 LysE family translocator [Gammaproteobacteria bacterium]NND58619.1 LysE family translocator [Xanthomonadales bacterium]NNK50991.1 LysE family translocator [Xanthomonadales bacterium]